MKVLLRKREHLNSDYAERIIINVETKNAMFIGQARTIQDYINECLHGENECAELLDKFTHANTGKDIILWWDSETGETFISY